MENFFKKPVNFQNIANNTQINDRFIPNRALSNMEISQDLFFDKNNSCELNKNTTNNRKRPRVLSLHTKSIDVQYENYANTHFAKKSIKRCIPVNPERVLDAPELKDDYYLNLIDWSANNLISVPLNRELYIWNETERNTTLLFKMNESDINGYLSSTSWMPIKDNRLAVGCSNSEIVLWDVTKQTCFKHMRSQASRIGSLCWNQNVLTSGSLLGTIYNFDERASQSYISSFKGHELEICGLKWSPNGRYLASGGNDNLVSVWDSNMIRDSKPLYSFTEHSAAVKAISWCPWKTNILATGGGRADGKIKLWNIFNGDCMQTKETDSQISSLIWSKEFKELITSHGGAFNQLSIWKCPDLIKVSDLKGHSKRILTMSMSPDQETVLSASADETLRLWRCFGLNERQKRRKLVNSMENTSSVLSSSRYIR